MMPRFIALLLIALMFVCSPVMAGAAPDPCGVADSCKTCVATDGCGWCGESLECKKKPGMFGGGCKGMLKETKAIKAPPTGQREVELTLEAELPGKWCAFRPQYIYGPRGRRADVSDALRRRHGLVAVAPRIVL